MSSAQSGYFGNSTTYPCSNTAFLTKTKVKLPPRDIQLNGYYSKIQPEYFTWWANNAPEVSGKKLMCVSTECLEYYKRFCPEAITTFESKGWTVSV